MSAPDYTKMDAPKMLAELGTYGRKWAIAFCQHTGFSDVDLATAWFCNAIMAQYDADRGNPIQNGDHADYMSTKREMER